MSTNEILYTGYEAIDPTLMDIEATGDGIGAVLPDLPEVGTYIPVVDGPVKPDYLLPEDYALPLTPTAQLALDLSTLDGSMSWIDDVFTLPLDDHWWNNMHPTLPVPAPVPDQAQVAISAPAPVVAQAPPEWTTGDPAADQMLSDLMKDEPDFKAVTDPSERLRLRRRAIRIRRKVALATGFKPVRHLKKDDPDYEKTRAAKKAEQKRRKRAALIEEAFKAHLSHVSKDEEEEEDE